MNKQKRFLYGFGGAAFCLLMAIGIFLLWQNARPTPTIDELYDVAMQDAMVAQEDEIFELVSLTPQDPQTTWDDDGRVLLLSFHSYPDSYPAGETLDLTWGSVWAFTDKELAKFYHAEKDNVTDWTLRLEQLIGLPEHSGYTVITGMWVSPVDVIRPAYQSDITDGSMSTTFSGEVDATYQEWFDDNILGSYYYGAYPWTRLGYTYDWADNGSEYGLTEFLISENAEVLVEYTLSVEDLWALFDEAA